MIFHMHIVSEIYLPDTYFVYLVKGADMRFCYSNHFVKGVDTLSDSITYYVIEQHGNDSPSMGNLVGAKKAIIVMVLNHVIIASDHQTRLCD